MATRQETTVSVPPQMVKFWDTAVGKTLRAAIYLGVSAAVAGVIAAIENDPTLFGVVTPIVNLVLVLGKNYFDPNVKNI